MGKDLAEDGRDRIRRRRGRRRQIRRFGFGLISDLERKVDLGGPALGGIRLVLESERTRFNPGGESRRGIRRSVGTRELKMIGFIEEAG
jgi:hypothetical protein